MRFNGLVLAGLIAILGLAACKPAPSTGTVSAAPAPAQQTPQASAPTVGSAAPASSGFTGAVAETMNSGGYTYARLTSGTSDVWVAAPEFDARVGEQVSVSLEMPMQDFQSKTLNRSFPMLYFVAEVARNGQPLSAEGQRSAPALMNSHGANAAAEPVEKVEPPAGGVSVANVFARKAALSGKSVTVRGKVVKFNAGIMDRNWLHIQDGSGTADASNNDLTVTTDAEVKVGDIVTVSGVLGTARDFGAGYAYDAILEKATVIAR